MIASWLFGGLMLVPAQRTDENEEWVFVSFGHNYKLFVRFFQFIIS